jgi:type II secretory ATPase GspE/PulE/Tfp pilus assembly ATPase PilB-like protein
MQISQGLVLVVGPTNSGKSTTIAGALGEHVKLFGDRRKRLSVEDPIERFVYGVQQYNVPPHIKDDTQRFEIILRAFKRHDPDIIWVGEVRDKVTADLCVSAATTGHLVLSTLHANDTVIAFDALAKTVEREKRFQLVESMSLLISQRLVKAVCPHCCRIGPPTDDEHRLFQQYLKLIGESAELPETIAHANPQGCPRCDSGYVGLLPINEVLPFDRRGKNAAIALLDGENRRDTLAKARTITLMESARRLLAQHKVDLEAVII